MPLTKERMEEIRASLDAECVSWGELAELTDGWESIDPDDAQLLEAAGVCEQCRQLDCACDFLDKFSLPEGGA